MSLLAISRILALFVNALTDDDNYSLRNRQNLQQPIQMQLSKKLNMFLTVLHHFRSLHYVFNILIKD